MKIATLRNPIKHERKIEELIAEIDSMINEICPMDEVAEAMIETLRIMNPATKEVIVVGHVCMIEMGEDVKEVDITGFSFADLFTTMIAEVIRK